MAEDELTTDEQAETEMDTIEERSRIAPVKWPRAPHHFKPGNTANPAGGPTGPRKVTVEAKAAAAEIVDNPEYRLALAERIRKGTAPHMEPLLWAYAKGKPVDRVEQGGPGAFAALDDDELRKRLAEVVLKLA